MKKITTLLLSLLTTMTMFSQKDLITLSKEFKENEELRLKEVNESSFVKSYTSNGEQFDLQFIENGFPIYYKTFNVAAAKSTRANHLNSNGSLGLNLNGQGITYHVWDSGHALSSHQEFGGRISIMDGVEVTSYHGTHVIGTIIASGVSPLAKGMAPQGLLRSYNWGSDLSEATLEANGGMLLSNHSYGFSPGSVPDYYFGAYISTSKNWDTVMFNAPYYLMCVAAGNDGTTVYNESPLNPLLPQYDKLTGHATSKNNLTVASSEDAVVSDSGDLISVSISNFSSQGPTDDLRIKPDITGNGRGLYSTYNTSPTSYSTLSGTSMATPNVVGTLGLLQQYYYEKYNTYMRASTLKGLSLHTADDAGSVGPDANFGWGLLNAKAAAQTITNNPQFSVISELTLTPNETYTLNVTSDNISKLVASISWTDPSGVANTGTINSSSPVLVNDLDIRIIKDGVTYFPWKLTSVSSNDKGDNNVDPYEKIEIVNATGVYTIQVTHKGSLTNSIQNFSLIVTGINNGTQGCSLITPTGVFISDITETTSKVSWNFVPNLTHELRYRAIGETNWITIASNNSFVLLNNLLADTQYEVQVRSKCGDNYTNYSDVKTFFTKKPCFPVIPENIQATQIKGTSSVITWNSIDYATYEVWVKKQIDQTGYIALSNTNSKLIAGLTPATIYEIRVRTKCDSGVSEWSLPTIFTTGPACVLVPPTSISSSNISTSTATISWSPVPGVTYYNIRWKAINSNTYSISNNVDPTRTISNLLPETTYEVQTQSVCENGSASEWSSIHTFTTLSGTCVPTMPTNISISNILTTSAYVSWVGVNPSYYLSWRKIGSTITSSAIITTPYYQITNLASGVEYTLELRGRCENGNLSTMYTTTFTTTGVCSPTPPVNVGISNITTNSVLSQWSGVNSAVSYNVRYKSLTSTNYNTFDTTLTAATLYALSPGTTYIIEVQSVCLNGTASDWSTPVQFTTLGDTPTCSPTTPTNITSTLNGFVSWNVVPLATYEIRFTKAKGKPSYTMYTTTTNSYQLNLQSNTKYKIEVRSRCGNQVSSWGSVTITTSNTTNEYFVNENSYPNPVVDILYIRNEGYIKLYNHLGVLVYQSEYVEQIDMSSYSSGMYFLMIGDTVEKIIKTK